MLALVLVSVLCFTSYSSKADVTNDILNETWDGEYGTGWWGGTAGGDTPNKIPNGGGFIWGLGGGILTNTVAINTALQQAGIQVDGFQYTWKVKNGNANKYAQQPGIDPFIITVDVYKADGTLYSTYEYDYGFSHNWTSHTGVEAFANQFLDPAFFGNITVTAEGTDNGNWAGWYGPEFNTSQSSINLVYSTNPCHNNQLYDPACLGYAAAYAEQLFNEMCTANPLYDQSCSGYTIAYFTQQCNSNPLHHVTCTGYAIAYLNQQCELNALYDSSCSGYDEAYLLEQCSHHALYDQSCSGYTEAYYLYQCTASPLYDSGCIGYKVAYLNYQCSINALYDTSCNGYTKAYYSYQCTANPLYDSGCSGHFEAQCSNNALYDMTCTGYSTAFYNQQCIQNPQYDVDCIGYIKPIISTPDPIIIAQPTITDDPIVDEVISSPPIVISQVEDTSPTIEKIISEPVVVIDATPPSEAVIVEPMTEITMAINKLEDDIEEEIRQLEVIEVEVIEEEEAKKSRLKKEKIKKLIASKAAVLAKQLGEAASLDVQRDTQSRILALLGFVPEFSEYVNSNKLEEVTFYPDKPVVDNQYARWFLNDPKFSELEDLQYPNGFK